MWTKWTTDSALKKIKDMWGDRVIVPDDFVYLGVDELHKFVCPVHGEFRRTFYVITHTKNPCGDCAPNNRKSPEEILLRFRLAHGSRYSYPNFHKNYMPNRRIEILCADHGIFKQSCYEHSNGAGCHECAKDKRAITINRFLFDSIKEHGDRYEYSLIYPDYKNTKSMVKIICKKHGIFDQLAGDHRRGVGCPKCNESKGERLISEYLEQVGIVFETQKMYEDGLNDNGNKFKYDFYLPEYNILIEYDGGQHYKKVFNRDLDAVKESDTLKNKFANEKNISLYRIFDYDNIIEKLKNIIQSCNRL